MRTISTSCKRSTLALDRPGIQRASVAWLSHALTHYSERRRLSTGHTTPPSQIGATSAAPDPPRLQALSLRLCAQHDCLLRQTTRTALLSPHPSVHVHFHFPPASRATDAPDAAEKFLICQGADHSDIRHTIRRLSHAQHRRPLTYLSSYSANTRALSTSRCPTIYSSIRPAGSAHLSAFESLLEGRGRNSTTIPI
ncbi:hypothetical protein KC350_g6 [Hortaea werneckii]|nr:hypothetical protein KC350_g6 [Hortaea werneckii]